MLHTHSPELDVSTHFELDGPAHDVDPLVTANDSRVAFNVQVRCRTAGDLKVGDRMWGLAACEEQQRLFFLSLTVVFLVDQVEFSSHV